MTDMSDIESAFPDIQTNLSNPEPRCPVVLLLDVSASMQGVRSRTLNEGVDQFNYHLRPRPTCGSAYRNRHRRRRR